MLNLMGSLLIICGSTGFGCLYLENKRRRIEELRQIAYLFKLLKSEINFKKQPLPCACRAAAEKMKGSQGGVLKAIAEEMEKGTGRNFGELWKEKWRAQLKESCLSGEEQVRILDFASFVGYEEEELQESMMEYQVEEFAILAKKAGEELEKKKKVVLLLCSCMGILFVLILL